MELDQFMKKLIIEFLVEVVTLFFPSLAQRLNFAQKKDLNKQLYTGSPQATERFVDVLIEVPVIDPPPDSILLHIESQQQKRFDFPARMLAYRNLIGMLSETHSLPAKSDAPTDRHNRLRD